MDYDPSAIRDPMSKIYENRNLHRPIHAADLYTGIYFMLKTIKHAINDIAVAKDMECEMDNFISTIDQTIKQFAEKIK